MKQDSYNNRLIATILDIKHAIFCHKKNVECLFFKFDAIEVQNAEVVQLII